MLLYKTENSFNLATMLQIYQSKESEAQLQIKKKTTNSFLSELLVFMSLIQLLSRLFK